MEGERLAKTFNIYKTRYRNQVLQQKREQDSKLSKANGVTFADDDALEGQKAPASTSATSKADNRHDHASSHALKRPSLGRKKSSSVDLVRKIVPERQTDGLFVELTELNGYTSEKLKDEMSDLETMQKIQTISLCQSCHGGYQDNPKEVTRGIGNVIEKWEFTYRLLEKKKSEKVSVEKKIMEDDSEDDFFWADLSDLHRCYSFDDLTPHAMQDIDQDTFSEQNFIDTLNESTEKIMIHGSNVTKTLLQMGEFQTLLALLGSVTFAKNRLAFYANEFGRMERNSALDKSIADLNGLIAGMMNQICDKQKSLVLTTVLHDTESQDWPSPNPYYESRWVSPTIQLWSYHMQGLRGELNNTLPPSMARELLFKVLESSLACLAVRYCLVTPSNARLQQFQCDLTAILLTTHDLLLGILPQESNINALLSPSRCPMVRSIHAKCTVLLSALSIIACPLNVLADEVKSLAEQRKLEPREKTIENFALTKWMHLMLPGIYGLERPLSASNIPLQGTDAFLCLASRMCALQPQHNWPLLVRLCLSCNMKLPRLIMENFGAFVPGSVGHDPPTKGMKEGCGGVLCSKRCLAAADTFWPQAVASGFLYVVFHGNPEKDSLNSVLEPLLVKLSPQSWDVLDANLIWNLKKPIWFQALLDLLEPYFFPILDDLFDDVDSGRTWTLGQVPVAVNKLSSSILDVAHLIPPSLYQVCELIESLLPDKFGPACDSVVAHLFLSTIYGILYKLIPVFRDWRMQREKIDFLVAVAEKLIHLDSSTEMQTRLASREKIARLYQSLHQEMEKLEGLTDASSTAKTEKNHRWDDSTHEFTDVIANMIANHLLSDPLGQEALKAIHRFVAFNSEWIQQQLHVEVALNEKRQQEPEVNGKSHHSHHQSLSTNADKAKLVPWSEKSFRVGSPFEMIETFGPLRSSFSLAHHPVPWHPAVRFTLSNLSPQIVLRLMDKRPECPVSAGHNQDAKDAAAFEEIKVKLIMVSR